MRISQWFTRKPHIVATGREGRSIWEELNEQLPRPTDFTFEPEEGK